MTPDEAELEILTNLPKLLKKVDPGISLQVCLSRCSKDKKIFYKAVQAASEYQAFKALELYIRSEFDLKKKEASLDYFRSKGFVLTKKQINKMFDKTNQFI
jgi:hypothetical protein